MHEVWLYINSVERAECVSESLNYRGDLRAGLSVILALCEAREGGVDARLRVRVQVRVKWG